MSKKFGFSLVEIGIVLLIAAAIIYGTIRLLGTKKDDAAGLAEAAEVNNMILAVQKANLYGANLAGDNASYINAKVLPSTWKISGNNITHGLGGLVTVMNFVAGPYEPNLLHFNLGSIPNKDSCVALASALSKNSQIRTVWAGNTNDQPDLVKPANGPLDYATLQIHCAQTPPIRVAFDYYNRAK